jgi:multidrug efflux pump subunit AcrB
MESEASRRGPERCSPAVAVYDQGNFLFVLLLLIFMTDLSKRRSDPNGIAATTASLPLELYVSTEKSHQEQQGTAHAPVIVRVTLHFAQNTRYLQQLSLGAGSGRLVVLDSNCKHMKAMSPPTAVRVHLTSIFASSN